MDLEHLARFPDHRVVGLNVEHLDGKRAHDLIRRPHGVGAVARTHVDKRYRPQRRECLAHRGPAYAEAL